MSILKLSDQTKAVLAKLKPEQRAKVKAAAKELVEIKTRRILEAEGRLKAVADELCLEDQNDDQDDTKHRPRETDERICSATTPFPIAEDKLTFSDPEASDYLGTHSPAAAFTKDPK
jgi:hypothetical protein